MTDASRLIELLERTARGDQQAFRALYDSSSPHLFGLLLRMLRRRDWAEEVLQDCFLKIWKKADTYSADKGAPLTWLMTVARYRALDLLRVKRPEVEMPEEDEDRSMAFADESSGIDPESQAVASEGIGRLALCLDGLQEEQRRCVMLAYYEGYTHQELTTVVGAPLGTIKSWVRRGLQKLRECLGE